MCLYDSDGENLISIYPLVLTKKLYYLPRIIVQMVIIDKVG